MPTPLVKPTAYQIVAFLNFFQEARNFFRVVLQVAAHGNDHVAARKIKAGFQGGRLPEIPPQPHQIHAPVVLVNFRKHLERFVLAAVIHKHQFVRLAEPVHHFGELHVKWWDVFLFIEERNDNGILNWRIACHSSLQYPFIKLPGPRSHSLSGESPAMRQDF